MATHSSILAWRIPGTGEPGGLPSMGSHRVGHDWSDLAAAAAYYIVKTHHIFLIHSFINRYLVSIPWLLWIMLPTNMATQRSLWESGCAPCEYVLRSRIAGSYGGLKMPWRRERLTTLVFWPGEFHGLCSHLGSQKVRHDWVTFITCLWWFCF